MKRMVAAVAVALSISPASAGFFTYAEWLTLSKNGRATYIAGVYDTLSGVAFEDTSARYAQHIGQCFSKSKMQNGQMAENLVEFVKTRPQYQAGTVVNAYVNYVIEACGLVPDAPK